MFNANSVIFQLYDGENKLIFNEMMMRFALYYTNTLIWIFIVLGAATYDDCHGCVAGYYCQYEGKT
jgi:hypothetical protein